MKVELLSPETMDRLDAWHLARSALKAWRPVNPLEILARAREGHVGIYRLSDDDGLRGIFVLEPDGDRAEILAIAGKKFLQHFSEVHKIICDTAKGCGCSRVSGTVARPSLQRLYAKHTAAKTVAHIIVEDLI